MISMKIVEGAHAIFEKFMYKKFMDSKSFMLIKLIRNAIKLSFEIYQFNKLLPKQEDRFLL